MHERITGPFRGYHIAVYACPMGELGSEYLGQFKVCKERPESFWSADCTRHGQCDVAMPAAATALNAAELIALAEVTQLPPTEPQTHEGLASMGNFDEPTMGSVAGRKLQH